MGVFYIHEYSGDILLLCRMHENSSMGKIFSNIMGHLETHIHTLNLFILFSHWDTEE